MILLAILAGVNHEARFVAGAARGQSMLLPECLDDWIDESNCVRVIDAFVDLLDLAELSFEGVELAATGRPAYHPSVLACNRRWLERDAGHVNRCPSLTPFGVQP